VTVYSSAKSNLTSRVPSCATHPLIGKRAGRGHERIVAEGPYPPLMEAMEFGLENGHPVAGPGWVYAWIVDGRIFYIGATWLHPAVRAEMHLHDETEDPRSLAIREFLNASSAAPTIVAIPVPMGLDRKAMKDALIAACMDQGWLAAGFIGPGHELRITERTTNSWLSGAITTLGERVR